jgi:ribonuclease VapC
MMVIDSSAIVAIALDEPEADSLTGLLSTDEELGVAGASYVECVMVLSGCGKGRAWLDDFVSANEITILASDERQARLAADAFERYGRGKGHGARLNFGDCFAYAAAKALDAPLLFKGDDFRHTDVKAAA